MARQLERRTIRLKGNGVRDRDTEAIIVGERVAVHRGMFGNGHTITDPVTGLAFWHHPTISQAAMLRKARAFVKEFGSNPLKGMAMKGDKLTRRPPRATEMREFFLGK